MSLRATLMHKKDKVRGCYYDFCKQTILHGWHYLVDSGSNGEGVSGIVGCSGEPELGSDDRCGKVRKRRSKEKEYRSVAAAVASSSKEPRGAASRRRAALGTSVLRCCCECGHTADTCCNGSDGGGGADGSPSRWRSPKPKTSRTWKGNNASLRLKREMRVGLRTFRFTFWLLIVLASVISGALFLYNNTTEFWNSTVQTTLDGSVPLSEVFFPSVLVCNINQIRKSFFSELGFYENDTLVRIMYEDFIKGTADMERRRDDDEAHFSQEVLRAYLNNKTEVANDTEAVPSTITWLIHQKCSDMFMYSKWNGSKTYGFGNNERDFGTDYGICCWYTPQLNFSAIPDGPDTDWAYWFNSVPKGAMTGKDNGFSVLFDIESYDYGYYDEGSEGLKVAVVHHLDMPIIRQRAFHVAPGTENQIPVTPTLYTATDQVITRFNPMDRDCYAEDEIDLMYLPKSHGYRYEMSNCLFEAAYEKILERCHCAPGFHIEGGASAFARYPVCRGKQLTCSNNILNRMGEFNEVHDIISNQTKICLANCEDQINDLFVTTSNYPNKKTFKEREEFCLLVKKLVKTCGGHKRQPLTADYPNLCNTLLGVDDITHHCGKFNRWRMKDRNQSRIVEQEIFNYARENLAVINIFIKEPYTKRFRKTEKMSRTAYIASSGGLLGLCMGFSFVSLAEIAYHCFICCGLLFSSSSGSAAKSVKDFGDNEGSSGGSDGGGGGGDGDKRRRRSVADGCEVNGDGG